MKLEVGRLTNTTVKPPRLAIRQRSETSSNIRRDEENQNWAKTFTVRLKMMQTECKTVRTTLLTGRTALHCNAALLPGP